ncbi:hypothetical protein [Dokdonia donghaensis]|uniref:Phage protein n=1 Tax=Dokdonia donghaensis DSW-1 TaxID=1300343 RepID=A0A0A2GSJ3_9FLAO|nr:hypothetical protein [Dokdonia donghaensis]ANH61358.1 hypothetical protein I597_2461 [Dokdonia donghaensis DSW-1]KGO05453.1 hypothetical protein NV36_00395 [Dokdonia donghaensis DSW-1]
MTKKSKKLQKFEADRADYTDREIQMEMLYTNWLIINATEKTRANTSTIVWVIAIGIILSVISAVMAVVW